jgi:hypothetical protein
MVYERWVMLYGLNMKGSHRGVLNRKFQIQDRNKRPVGKTKNKMVGHHPEGHVTDPRNMKIEKSRRQRRVEVSS